MESTIAKPLKLKCGLELKNRLVKASMAENMADADGMPTEVHNGVYTEWAESGWGMVLTGKSHPMPFLTITFAHLLVRKCHGG